MCFGPQAPMQTVCSPYGASWAARSARTSTTCPGKKPSLQCSLGTHRGPYLSLWSRQLGKRQKCCQRPRLRTDRVGSAGQGWKGRGLCSFQDPSTLRTTQAPWVPWPSSHLAKAGSPQDIPANLSTTGISAMPPGSLFNVTCSGLTPGLPGRGI